MPEIKRIRVDGEENPYGIGDKSVSSLGEHKDETTSNFDEQGTDFALAGATVQVEQFISIFLENTTAVMFKKIMQGKAKPKKTYHEYRQLLIYLEGFHQLMYDDEMSEKIVDLFIARVPNDLQVQDQYMFRNYIRFFQEFFSDLLNACNFTQRKKVEKRLKDVAMQLEKDYGYEAKLETL